MTVREADHRPVAVGVDGSSDALRATRWAAREAARRRVRLEVFHALDLPEKYPEVMVERAPIRDRAVSALLRLSERARLVIVGSRGRGGFSGLLLGSTSQALMHHAACPVLIARPAPANEQAGHGG